MAKTLDQMTYNNWAFGGSAGYARYEFSDSFTDEDGREFGEGASSYLEVPTTISGSVVTVPAYPDFPETEAAVHNNGVTVTCHLLDSTRNKKAILFDSVRIYTSLPSTISLSQLVLANGASRLLRDDDVWTKEQVIDYVATRPPAVKMTPLVHGIGRLSVPAADPADPIAAGNNDPRLITASFYATLADAIAAIGSVLTTLVVDAPIAAAGASSPANITLRFTNSGQLTGSGTVTILGPINAPPRQIFATTLTVSLTGNAFVNNLCVDWFETIVTNSTDATVAIQKAVDTFDSANKSGNVLFQNKVYLVAGALQDTGASNAQIVLPKRPTTNLALGFVGVPPDARTVINVDTAGTVIKSTLATGNGNMIGTSPRSFLSFYGDNFTLRMPANPTNSCLDLTNVVNLILGDIKIDTGEPFDTVTQPTTSTSYGIKMPQVNLAGMTEVRSLLVQGFYTGIKGGELSNFNAVTVANGVYTLETPAAFHSNYIGLFLDEKNVNGIRATGGASSWVIGLYDVERATTGWQARADDIVDASNFLHARITWHVVTISVGVTHTFTISGGAYVYAQELQGAGTEIFSSFNSLEPKLLELNSLKSVSTAANVPWLSLVHNQTNTAELVGALSFSNLAIAAAQKRLGQISVQTNGATDTGRFNFALNTAGTLAVEWIMRGGSLITALDGGADIGTLTDFRPDNVHAKSAMVAGSVRGRAVAFAALPASPVEGMMVGVTDSNTATWGATIAGGGANHVLAYYNGTNWKVAG